MRQLLAAALIFVAIGPVPGTTVRRPVENDSQTARALPIRFAEQPAGTLRFVRGWHLVSPNNHFGGFSALARPSPGDFRLIGDNGYATRLVFGASGMVERVSIRPVPTPDGRRGSKSMVDTEAFFIDSRTGQYWVALEVRNEVWRLSPDLGRVESRGRLPRWPKASGPEAMVHLGDGRTVIFSENARDDPRGREALLFTEDPAQGKPKSKPLRFFYDAGGRGNVSDAALLPDGRLLIVHRKLGFDPFFTTILAVLDPADIAKDAVVRSVTIGQVPRPLADNFEGATVAVENGRTWLWLVSDNNFNNWQRSLLLQFELADLPPRKADGKKAAR